MTVFTCDGSFEGQMTCIYDAWAARLGHANVRLLVEPVGQPELFCDYIHVEADAQKTAKVVRSIQNKISYEAYSWIYYAAMSPEEDALDTIYRFMVMGFAYGREVTKMLAQTPVARMLQLKQRVGNEAHFFREFARFDRTPEGVYVCHIEPKSDVTAIVANHFFDRMPSEYWMIIDDCRRIAAVHPKDEAFYLTALSAEEMQRLRRTETAEDLYTMLWREFFEAIGIEQRKNPKCQRNMMPLWYRKHALEHQPLRKG